MFPVSECHSVSLGTTVALWSWSYCKSLQREKWVLEELELLESSGAGVCQPSVTQHLASQLMVSSGTPQTSGSDSIAYGAFWPKTFYLDALPFVWTANKVIGKIKGYNAQSCMKQAIMRILDLILYANEYKTTWEGEPCKNHFVSKTLDLGVFLECLVGGNYSGLRTARPWIAGPVSSSYAGSRGPLWMTESHWVAWTF